MKKTMAFILALVLTCFLCVPALAAEETGAVELMEELGLLEEVGDYGFTVDGEPVPVYEPGETPPMDPDGTDPVDEYIAAHPEEIAALDADALLAGWGYPEPREAFMDDWGDMADSFETAVAMRYASKRVDALENIALAEEYKTEYPEAWAAFDMDAYLEEYIGFGSKEEVKAENNLLSDEELADHMFLYYVEKGLSYDEETDTWTWSEPIDWYDPDDDPDAEPTLTLVVNGVASNVAISANDWTTYADAAELRGILGVKAVAPTYEGPVPVREAAENAGWEVQWYDGGWEGLDQQVCLWNKDAFLAEIAPKVEGFQTLYDAAMDRARGAVFTETPRRTVENATVTFKRFNSLDGDKTYDLKLRAETVWQKGVMDCTITFDVAQLLAMFTDRELEVMALEGDFSLADLKTLAGAGKIEAIIDFNSGGMALNAPLLGLIDEDLTGWQTTYTARLDYSQENADYAETLYENMLATATYWGGVTAREGIDEGLEAIAAFFGQDSVKTTGSTVTWSVETDKVNAALSKLVGDGDKTFSLFKKCDLNMTIDAAGKLDLTLAYRVDPEGNFEATVADGGIVSLDTLKGGSDMELTATAHGELGEGTQTLKLHIKNFGTFDVNIQVSTTSAAQGPRQLAQVEREWVKGDVGGGDKS